MKNSDKNSCAVVQEHSKVKLLRAAFEVFSKHGFEGSTTKQISQAAGVNEALIMRHFKSKEGLFFAVVEQHMTCEPCELDYQPCTTLADEFARFCESIFDRDLKKADFLKIVISHSLLHQDFAQRLHSELVESRAMKLQPRLLALQESGELPKNSNFEQIEYMLKNQVFSAVFFHAVLGIHSEKEARDLLLASARTLAAGLTAQQV